MSSKAVLFGIDYLADGPNRLRGCSTDVEKMSQFLLEEEGFDVVETYTEQSTPAQVTSRGILEILFRLAAESPRLSRAWIHFSGHGTSVLDRSGDEADGRDEAICPVDYAEAGVITDDLLTRILRLFHPATKVVCVFDCCHSGSVGDLAYNFSPGVHDHAFGEARGSRQECPAEVVLFSGCRDDQTSADAFNVAGEYRHSGAMSSCFLDAVKRARSLRRNSGGVTLGPFLRDLRGLLRRRGFRQVPMVTSSRKLEEGTVLFG